jgi:hypothetical protein
LQVARPNHDVWYLHGIWSFTHCELLSANKAAASSASHIQHPPLSNTHRQPAWAARSSTHPPSHRPRHSTASAPTSSPNIRAPPPHALAYRRCNLARSSAAAAAAVWGVKGNCRGCDPAFHHISRVADSGMSHFISGRRVVVVVCCHHTHRRVCCLFFYPPPSSSFPHIFDRFSMQGNVAPMLLSQPAALLLTRTRKYETPALACGRKVEELVIVKYFNLP